MNIKLRFELVLKMVDFVYSEEEDLDLRVEKAKSVVAASGWTWEEFFAAV